MDNGGPKDGIKIREVVAVACLGIAGISGIRWILRHPEQARQIDMGILLGTQKASLAVSDGLRRSGDAFRFVADKAGTQYNKIRSI